MVDISSLNANQLRAVNWGNGPLMVLAGPGSGKTSVLAHRIARIVKESADESFRILGLTFTNKAATEMRRRVRILVPNAEERVNLTTYHSFSTAILRQHGHHLGISPSFSILTHDIERMVVLDEAIASTGTDIEYDNKYLLSYVTTLMSRNISVDMATESLQNESPDRAQQIGEIYGRYRQLMIKNNELDFDGLIAEALRLLTDTHAADLIRRIYPYVCVDEFQDTSLAEYQLLCEIVDPITKNLFVVADDDQTIYEWNGASQDRLTQLREQFGMTVYELPENYRCPSDVVKMANSLIVNNPGHHKAESIACKPSGRVRVMTFDTAEEEVDWIVQDIAKMPADSRRNCAILARTRKTLKQVAAALEARGIRAHLYARKDEFANERMVWLHSVIRLANSRQDTEQLRRVCKSFSILEGVDLITPNIVFDATTRDDDYLCAWLRVALREDLDTPTRSFLEESIPKLIDRLDVESFVSDCFAWFEQRQKVEPAPDYAEYCEERNAWDTLVKEATEEMGQEQMTLRALLDQIDLRSKEPPIRKDAIPCCTIFASKGREFDHVYLIRLVEDELPVWWAVKEGDKSRKMQEERRICFVAITRTQKSLTITYPRDISGYAKSPSRFLAEMGLPIRT